MSYFGKMKGGAKSPPGVGFREILWSWLGAFIGISLVACIHYGFLGRSGLVFLIAPFGASAVLVYGAPRSPLAQPRNLIGGHVFSALVGVVCYKLFGAIPWLASSLAVATAIAVMHVTRTVHPPGGATALIAVIGDAKVHSLGYFFALVPVGLGVLLMLVVALIVNNIPEGRRYPEFWF